MAFKDGNAYRLHKVLGQRLAALISSTLDLATKKVTMVPVPSSPKAIRRRGFSHMSCIGQVAAGWLQTSGVEAQVCQALTQSGGIDQTLLTKAGRSVNKIGKIGFTGVAPTQQSGAVTILIDDICTTGSTLHQSWMMLRLNRVQVDGAAVVTHVVFDENNPEVESRR